uniref:Tryptophan synthase alpha chain n=1 Tax=Hildenbrandia rivularis TaxID=135206 RepID=A0A1C9CFC6_9FLOR|nr:tryptophan synthase alpha subunit [Hildenbrandia rivularis]AOM67118.1 tryptophan synthase alpha subunit [Hildenbrandia rivularis]
MTRISQVIQQSTSTCTCALIVFITAGDPNLNITKAALEILDKSGVNVIELGLPYSVPLADGPIIQTASNRALMQDTNLDKILNMLNKVNLTITTPIILFTYYNPVLSRGIFTFICDISRVGVKGLIIPDLPFEESAYIAYLCDQFSIELIFLIAPTSTVTRIHKIAKKSSSCIYLVSKTGVTGMHTNKEMFINSLITKVKKITSKPLIVGFGISTLNHIRSFHQLDIEGIVLGSAFVQRLANQTIKTKLEEISEFCHAIKQITTRNSQA